jgi:hypothetical protein
MNTPDDPSEELDRRSVRPHHFWSEVILVQDALIVKMKRAGVAISENAMLRMKYVEAVLMHGNQGGKSNPTIDLPVPWTLADIEAVIGHPNDTTPGSDASWRAVRKHYDATHGGRLMADGRTR